MVLSKIVSGSRALPPRWPPQCSCVVIESSFDPGERLQAPGSLWLFYSLQENAFDEKSDHVVYSDIKVEYKPNSSINL